MVPMKLTLAMALMFVVCSTAQTTPFHSTIVTIGVEYSNNAARWSGWIAGGVCLHGSGPCSGTYSLTGSYLTVDRRNGVVSNYTTGGLQHMRDIGKIRFFGLGAAGAAVSTGSPGSTTSVGLALNGGLLTVIPVSKDFSVDVLTQALSSAGPLERSGLGCRGESESKAVRIGPDTFPRKFNRLSRKRLLRRPLSQAPRSVTLPRRRLRPMRSTRP
jgi:hypothetical protein